MGTRCGRTDQVRRCSFNTDMSSNMCSLVRVLIPTTSMHVSLVQEANRSASVRTRVLSISVVKKPIEVGSERPCPAGIAIAERPSLKLFESEMRTSLPFVKVMIRTLIVPAEVLDENSVMSSNSMADQTPNGMGPINH